MRRVYSLLAILALSLAACKGTGEPESTPTAYPSFTPRPTLALTDTPAVTRAPSGTLSIWHSIDESQRFRLLGPMEAFQAQYPGVYFDMLYTPAADLLVRFETASSEFQPPTVLLGPCEWTQALVQQGYLAPLDDAWVKPLTGVLNPPALAQGRVDGKVYGLPYSVQGLVLYRNPEVIPQPSQTMEELIAAAKAATRGDLIGAYLERGVFFAAGHLTGAGGELLDANGLPAFNSPQGETWLNALKMMREAGPLAHNEARDLELFEAGKIGYIIDGTWSRAELLAKIPIVQVDPWPEYPGGRLSGYVQGDCLFLSAAATGEQAQLAQQFLNVMVSTDHQQALYQNGGLPARLDVQIPNTLDAQALTAMEDGAPYPGDQVFSIFSAPLELALRQVFELDQTPAEALLAAHQAALSALGLAEPTLTPTPSR